MQLEYLSLPLALDKLMRGSNPEEEDELNQVGKSERERARLRERERVYELPKCSLQQSVMQNLHLLLTTAFGEFPADDRYGCAIWDNDFDNVTGANKLKEIIRQSSLQAIQLYEKRLGNARVELMLMQEEIPEAGGKRVKKRIDISVSGVLYSTNERLNFRDSFFVGPFSY